MDMALEIAREHGGALGEALMRRALAPKPSGGEAVESGARAFLFAPYLRDTLVACGVLSETFETAITWDRFQEFHATAIAAVRERSPRSATPRRGGRAAGQLPLHPRLPGRPRSVLHGDGARGAAGRWSSGTR